MFLVPVCHSICHGQVYPCPYIALYKTVLKFLKLLKRKPIYVTALSCFANAKILLGKTWIKAVVVVAPVYVVVFNSSISIVIFCLQWPLTITLVDQNEMSKCCICIRIVQLGGLWSWRMSNWSDRASHLSSSLFCRLRLPFQVPHLPPPGVCSQVS